MRQFKNKKGFTLIEILIVVVILAVLAALILPKFLGQSERAHMAEAIMMLGAMARGQEMYMQVNNSPDAGYDMGGGAYCGGEYKGHSNTACDPSDWAALGMTAPNNKTNFAFYSDFDWVYARRAFSDSTGGYGYMGLRYRGPIRGWWECTGRYEYIDPADRTKGCRVA